jgi:hypothetical protein
MAKGSNKTPSKENVFNKPSLTTDLGLNSILYIDGCVFCNALPRNSEGHGTKTVEMPSFTKINHLIYVDCLLLLSLL